MRWRLFRVFGIPIRADASWLIILALITWILTETFRTTIPGLTRIDYWVMGVAIALAFFGCIVLHELGHALVARALGIPISGITLFVFGGVSEMEDEPPSARAEFLMAAAGPAVSVILWALFGMWAENAQQPTVEAPVAYLSYINGMLALFNLVPAFPLDGGRRCGGSWATSAGPRTGRRCAARASPGC